MSYEIHEQHRVQPPPSADDEQVTRWAVIENALSFRLGNQEGDRRIIYITDLGGSAITIPVDMRDVVGAFADLRRLHGYSYEGRTPLNESGRERSAEVIAAATTALRAAGDDDLATQLQVTGLKLIDMASRAPIPLASVDPEDFDEPIRTWRGMKRESEGMTEEERANAGIFSPEICAHYIDAWQSARKNVLGEMLPEGA